MGFFSKRKEQKELEEKMRKAANIAAGFEDASFVVTRRVWQDSIKSNNGKNLFLVGAGFNVRFDSIEQLKDYVLKHLISSNLKFYSPEDLQEYLNDYLSKDIVVCSSNVDYDRKNENDFLNGLNKELQTNGKCVNIMKELGAKYQAIKGEFMVSETLVDQQRKNEENNLY